MLGACSTRAGFPRRQTRSFSRLKQVRCALGGDGVHVPGHEARGDAHLRPFQGRQASSVHAGHHPRVSTTRRGAHAPGRAISQSLAGSFIQLSSTCPRFVPVQVQQGRETTILDVMSARYDREKEQLVRMERFVLRYLGFMCHVEHPHKYALLYLRELGAPELARAAWAACNDAALTDLPAAVSAEVIACGAVFLAAAFKANLRRGEVLLFCRSALLFPEDALHPAGILLNGGCYGSITF